MFYYTYISEFMIDKRTILEEKNWYSQNQNPAIKPKIGNNWYNK